MAVVQQSAEQLAIGFSLGVTTITDTGGGTSSWIPVEKDNVGIDLVVTTGSAHVESTASAPKNLANAYATTWDKGTISAGSSASSVVNGAAHVRLVATGAAVMSVRT